MTTLEIQRRLAALGFDPGPLDGVRGRLTVQAIKAFQKANGLAADGIVGPKTVAALTEHGARSLPPSQPSPASAFANASADKRGEGLAPWYDEALRLKGLREAGGAADNPTILGWARRLGISYASDSVPWCGLFVAHCIATALPHEPLPANPLGARNWLRFGIPTQPTLGAVLVFWRSDRRGALGHVGFYAGEDEDAYHVLGGNQSDSVSVTRLVRSRLLGARWPKMAPVAKGGSVLLSASGELSTNEA